MNTLEQIFKTVEFDHYLEENSNDESKWDTTRYDNIEDCDALCDAQYKPSEFKDDLEMWGGWMSDDFLEHLYDLDLVAENHYRIGSDIEEIDSISLNGKLLMWSLHQD